MKIGKYRVKTIRVLRTVSQILFFFLLPALYISTFSGLKAIYMSIYTHSFSLEALWPQLIEVIAIIPVTIVAGRFFCGWMCAFGAMGDFIYMLSQKVFKIKYRVNEKTDRILKYVKYIWLCFLVAVVWSFGVKLFATANPWDAFGMLLTPGSLPDFSYVAANLLPALTILLLIIGASFFIERFFCRYLCPLGAVFAVLSKLRITSIAKPTGKCGKCRICTSSCPMGIPLYKKDAWKSGECINCFECVQACPRKNVSLSVSESDVRPAAAGVMAAAVITGIYFAGSFASKALTADNAIVPQVSSSSSAAGSSSGTASAAGSSSGTASAAGGSSSSAGVQASSGESSASSSSKYKDGTYQGSGIGYRGGQTTVSVIIKSGKITDITTVSTEDTGRFYDSAYPVIVNSIISRQSSEVDAVSGATYSSEGIMQAVADALSKASK